MKASITVGLGSLEKDLSTEANCHRINTERNITTVSPSDPNTQKDLFIKIKKEGGGGGAGGGGGGKKSHTDFNRTTQNMCTFSR